MTQEASMIEKIKDILKGIDQTEFESSDGWWETSTGAKFGAEALKQVVEALAQPEQELWAGVDFDIKTTPPQRTWVGLDEKDFSTINQACLTKLQAAASAESILKEKNT